MSGYSKLVPEIVDSSIWNEPSDTRVVWITIIAIKDENGFVRGDARSLSRRANVTIEACEIAIKCFLDKDLKSSTPDNDGRRIEAVAGGWLVLNHEKYREVGMSEATKEYWRRKKREARERESGSGADADNGTGNEIPTLAMCQEFALHPTCGFPPELVEEWFNKSSDRGWGKDWRARMRGAVATYRAIHDERKTKGKPGEGGRRRALRHVA